MADQADDDLYFPPPRRVWRRRLKIAGIVLLLLLIAVEWFISARLGKKLRDTVATKLDAELRTRAVIYIPPYGMIVFEPRFTRGNETLIKASRLRVSLAGLPKKDEPLLISSLRVSSPRVYVMPGGYYTIQKPGGKHLEPKKLSDILRLREVRITDGMVQYQDPQRWQSPPMKWDGISIDLNTVQQSTSRYTFNLRARAQRTADASAAGTIDVDSLLLELRNLTLQAQAEPEPVTTPLPQAVQEFLKTYRINGHVTMSGNGSIPLREPGKASFNAKVAVENALAQFDKAKLAINRADAELLCSKQPDAPIIVQLSGIEMTSGTDAKRSLIVKKGQLTLDTSAGRWSLADVEGQITFEKALFTRVPLATLATTQPTDDSDIPGPKYEKYQPAGRADFSIAASGPFKIARAGAGGKWYEQIDHEFAIYPRGVSFVPKNFTHPIEQIAGGEARLRGGMIILQELTARYGDDQLLVHAARLPIESLPNIQAWQEISGAVTFHQPLRPYSPTLDNIFDKLNPDGTYLIAGSFTNDKTDPTTKPVKTYDLIVSSDTGAMLLTPWNIPFENIRGDATVTHAGVQLHGAAADVLNGKMTMTGQWMRTSDTARAYDGDMTMRDVDLARIKEVTDNPPKVSLRGKLSAQSTFSGMTLSRVGTAHRHRQEVGSAHPADSADESLKTLRAAGEMEILQGDFFKLPVLREIFQAMRLKPAPVTVGDAAAIFDIANAQITFRDAAVNAPILGLQGRGSLTFDGDVTANVVAAPLADWRDHLKRTNIPIVSDVTGELAGAVQRLLNTATGALLYEYRATGNLRDKIIVETIPTPALSDTAAAVFGRMLTSRKDQRPLDWFRRDTPQPNAK